MTIERGADVGRLYGRGGGGQGLRAGGGWALGVGGESEIQFECPARRTGRQTASHTVAFFLDPFYVLASAAAAEVWVGFSQIDDFVSMSTQVMV